MPPGSRRSPAFEPLEPRALLSYAGLFARRALMDQVRPFVSPRAAVAAVPTPHELAREAFSARFKGPYVLGPGRFSDEALRGRIYGFGTSNQFFHGDAIVSLVNSSDPSKPVTGLAALYPKNNPTTGSLLVLDLKAPPPVDPAKPPTHFNWTVDSSSAGTYLGASGSGTLDVLYIAPSGQLPARATGAGQAGLIFKGLINTTGVGNILPIDL